MALPWSRCRRVTSINFIDRGRVVEQMSKSWSSSTDCLTEANQRFRGIF